MRCFLCSVSLPVPASFFLLISVCLEACWCIYIHTHTLTSRQADRLADQTIHTYMRNLSSYKYAFMPGVYIRTLYPALLILISEHARAINGSAPMGWLRWGGYDKQARLSVRSLLLKSPTQMWLCYKRDPMLSIPVCCHPICPHASRQPPLVFIGM